MDKSMINYIVDMLMGVAFIITAITGLLIFFLMPPGNHNLFMGWGRHDWGLIHDWSGIAMFVLVALHFILHWNWMVCMTKNLFKKSKTCKR